MNMRRAAALLLMVCLAAFSFPAGAEENERVVIELTYQDGAWTVPEGVTGLEENLYFSGDMLPSIRFPSSMRVIDSNSELLYGFRGSRLVIPEGVVRMGEDILNYSAVKRVSLPSTLAQVSGSTFSDCDLLEFIRMPEDNPYFKVIDNVLFSKDGKTLVYYPGGKRDAHYDVPAGVRTIAEDAFCGNDSLRSLTLPIGFERMECCGISDCGRLESVSLPLTFKEMGDYCFGDCVSLAHIAVPTGVLQGDACFSNCPALVGNASEQLAGLQSVKDTRSYYDHWYYDVERPAMLSPDNAADMVRIYASPDEKTVLDKAGCGSYVDVVGESGNHYEISFYSDKYSEAEQRGFVRMREVYFCAEYEPLFEIESVYPKARLAASLGECRTLPTVMMRSSIAKDACDIVPSSLYGQWIECGHYYLVQEDNYRYIDYSFFGDGANYLWLGDVTVRRAYTGDEKTYGMTVATETRNRVNLRAQASKNADSLGKFFSGAQLEVLGEKNDFFHVRMLGGMEGYIMKEYVRIVEQEEF